MSQRLSFKHNLIAIFVCMAVNIGHAQDNTSQPYELDALLAMAQQQNPIIQANQALKEAATAGLTTARAYINPEFELMAGPLYTRGATSQTRNNVTFGIAQPLEFSSVREAKRLYAEQNINIVDNTLLVSNFDLRNQIKQAYVEVLKRQQMTDLQQSNFNLLKQIHSKVQVKVNTGEVPKYELIKADTELLSAERDLQTAQSQVLEAKAFLRRLIGPQFPERFEISEKLPSIKALPSLVELRGKAAESPYLQRLKSEKVSAEAKMNLEEKLRMPGLTFKSYFEQNPDANIFRLGLALPLPLWNQREGQIAEAYAGVKQAEAQLQLQSLSLGGELEAAYQRYAMAKKQVETYESGLLSQSAAVLERAESAYKYGERGILEYLDAQRVHKAVNKDYLIAKFDYLFNVLQIERLVGAEIVATQGSAS